MGSRFQDCDVHIVNKARAFTGEQRQSHLPSFISDLANIGCGGLALARFRLAGWQFTEVNPLYHRRDRSTNIRRRWSIGGVRLCGYSFRSLDRLFRSHIARVKLEEILRFLLP